MPFKEGENGPYFDCEVAFCDFWSGKPDEVREHLVKVHEEPEEEAERVVEEFKEYIDEHQDDEEDGKKTIVKPSLVLDGMLAEEVKGGKFALWNGGEVEYKDEIDLGDKILKPRIDDPLEMGAIHLPEKATDYGSTNELLEEIKEFIHEWVDMSKEFEEMSAWYVILTWVYDKVSTVPYLRFHGDLGTGKTQAIKTIGGLCYKATDAGGCTTAAAVERLVTHWAGTMVMNEADFRKSDTQADIVKLLNEGFESGGVVMKAHREDQDRVVATTAYAPKILATRERWDDQALESRCLTEEMRETDRDDILPLRIEEFREKQQKLRNKLLMFRFKNYHKIDEEDIKEIWPKIREMTLERRLIQATISFSVLFWQDEEMFKRFMNFLRRHQKKLIEERAATFDGGVVRAIYELRNSKYITCSDIATHLEDQQSYKDVRPSTVGKHLKNIGLETKYRKIEGETKKPLVSDEKVVNDTFKRYLPNYENRVPVKAVKGVKGHKDTVWKNDDDDSGGGQGQGGSVLYGLNALNSLNRVEEKLSDLLYTYQPKPKELKYHFDPGDLEAVNNILLEWKKDGDAYLDENGRWRLN